MSGGRVSRGMGCVCDSGRGFDFGFLFERRREMSLESEGAKTAML
jgi:hypothetical protein